MESRFGLLTLLFVVLFVADRATAQQAVLAGGNLDDGNAAVYKRFIEFSTKNGVANIGIISAASETPQKSAESYIPVLKQYGASSAEWIQIDLQHVRNNRDPKILARLGQMTGLYFTGGDQSRIIQSFMDKWDTTREDSPAMQLIRQRFNANQVAIMGTSAGTACQQAVFMITGGESYNALRYGPYDYLDKNYPDDLSYDPKGGIGLIPKDFGYLDTHYGVRGRQGRMFALAMSLKKKGGPLKGWGVDENTALIYDRGNVEVLGANGVFYMDFTEATIDDYFGEDISIFSIRTNYLTHGDKIVDGAFTPAPWKNRITEDNTTANTISSSDIFSSPNNLDRNGTRKNPQEFTRVSTLLLKGTDTRALGATYESGPSYKTDLVKDGRTVGYTGVDPTTSTTFVSYTNLLVNVRSDDRKETAIFETS